MNSPSSTCTQINSQTHIVTTNPRSSSINTYSLSHNSRSSTTPLLPPPCPPLLHAILLKIFMGIFITDCVVALHEASDKVSLLSHLHRMPHQLIVTHIHILTMLVLNDHVMHDHSIHHDVSKNLLLLEIRWTSHNGNLRMQNQKCSLDILLSSRLCIVNVLFFNIQGLMRGFTNTVHFR
jgi:hypothetical protein